MNRLELPSSQWRVLPALGLQPLRGVLAAICGCISIQEIIWNILYIPQNSIYHKKSANPRLKIACASDKDYNDYKGNTHKGTTNSQDKIKSKLTSLRYKEYQRCTDVYRHISFHFMAWSPILNITITNFADFDLRLSLWCTSSHPLLHSFCPAFFAWLNQLECFSSRYSGFRIAASASQVSGLSASCCSLYPLPLVVLVHVVLPFWFPMGPFTSQCVPYLVVRCCTNVIEIGRRCMPRRTANLVPCSSN